MTPRRSDAELEALSAAFEAVLDGPTLEEVAVACGVPVADVDALIDAGQLQAVRMDFPAGVLVMVPPWQLGPGGRPLPGLATVLSVLPAGEEHLFDVVVWATTPSPALDGCTPREWLLAGNDLDVLTAYATAWVLKS